MTQARAISYRPPPDIREWLEDYSARTYRNLTQSLNHLVAEARAAELARATQAETDGRTAGVCPR